MKLIHGDCLEVMADMDPESVDAVCTDPPYGLEFMGEKWDSFKDVAHAQRGMKKGPKSILASPGFDLSLQSSRAFQGWCAEWGGALLRVMKPGAYGLVFGGTRTYHRLTCGLEDAGFEIRDCLMWLYGQGFPKSRVAFPTALKPAWEPIVLVRKPFPGTVEGCVTSYGTGVLNVTDSRVGSEPRFNPAAGNKPGGASLNMSKQGMPDADGTEALGRWPSNLLLTHDDACVQVGRTVIKGKQMNRYTDGVKPFGGGVGHPHVSTVTPDEEMDVYRCAPGCPVGMLGDEHRFFYCAKASPAEKNAGLEGFDRLPAGGMSARRDGSLDGHIVYAQNTHPTVKPVQLMRYLVRLITPHRDGMVLDPFMGSGTTAVAASLEGRRFVGIEREKTYIDIAAARLAFWETHGEEALRIVGEREEWERQREAHRQLGQLDLFEALG